MTKIESMLKNRSFEEREEIYQLANWLQYKWLEVKDYMKWHLAIQSFIMHMEMQYPKRYYDEYFFPYIVVRSDRRYKGDDRLRSSKDWEKLFPNDYEELLEKHKEELESMMS